MTNALTLPPDALKQALREDPHLKSAYTRKNYAAALRAFDAWSAGRVPTRTLIETYAAHLQESGYAPNTVKLRLSAVLWRVRKAEQYALDYIDSLPQDLDPQEREDIRARVKTLTEQTGRILTIEVSKIVKGSRPRAGRHIKDSEFVALVRACLADPTPAGARDAALFATAWTTGMRVSEYGHLRIEHLHDREETGEDGLIEHYGELAVVGKGDKARPAYLYNGAYTALRNWLEIRGNAPGFIFCPVRKGGVPSPSYPISPQGLTKILKGRVEASGIDPLTWHDFRRTFGGNFLDNGGDVGLLKDLFGHSSVRTTGTYDRRPERARRAAVRSMRMPQVLP